MVSFSPDIIILGLIAGVILFRLYTVLGRKDDDGNVLSNRKNASFKNIIDISSTVKTEDPVVDLSVLEKDIAPEFEEVLVKIRKIDSNFSLQKFLDGAKTAFDMVLTAFANNDRETLKLLLGDAAYKQFIGEVDKRLANKVKFELTLVSLPMVEIKDIQLRNNKVSIDVLYGSQQINLLKDEKGDIIEGDVSQIDYIEDTWQFVKDLNGKANWKLVNVNAS
jgi:predicted lipid-binding transport protein (Tim44 family)